MHTDLTHRQFTCRKSWVKTKLKMSIGDLTIGTVGPTGEVKGWMVTGANLLDQAGGLRVDGASGAGVDGAGIDGARGP